ncbi:MAG: ABC transporter permease [Acidimicrobiia bacterium]|nr:ABC transporter permease [Acidimicrobiia bacterium]
MRAAFIIAAKDLSQRIRDRSAILLGLVAPLGLALIFGAIIPDTAGGSFDVFLGYVDEDRGQVSRGFIEEVLPDVVAEGLATATSYADLDGALADVEAGTIHALYVFPEGLSDGVMAGQGGTVRLVGNVDQSISTQIAEAILDGYLAEVDAISIAVGAAVLNGATDPEAIIATAAGAPAAVVLADTEAASRELDIVTFFSAGMAVFFLFFTVQFGVSSLLEERFHGTLPRLLGAPISRWSILGGKALTSFVLGIVSMIVLAVATTLLIGAEWGDPAGVLILMLAGVLSALGIMAVVAVVSKTPEQAANWQSIVAVVLGLLGGTFFPLSQGPAILSLFSKLTPHAWFLQGLGDLSAGDGLAVVVTPALAMLAFFVVTVALATLLGRGKVLAP